MFYCVIISDLFVWFFLCFVCFRFMLRQCRRRSSPTPKWLIAGRCLIVIPSQRLSIKINWWRTRYLAVNLSKRNIRTAWIRTVIQFLTHRAVFKIKLMVSWNFANEENKKIEGTKEFRINEKSSIFRSWQMLRNCVANFVFSFYQYQTEMDEDYENVLIKSPTVKRVNNNDSTLLSHNSTLSAPIKCNKSQMILPASAVAAVATTTATSNNHISNANFILSTSTNHMANINSITSASIDPTHSRLTFTSPKLMNSRDGHAIAGDCYETDTVDSLMVKEEPLSPDSSCPSSPNTSNSSTASIFDGASHIIVTQPTQQTNVASQFGTINVNLANVATYTNTDLVFEHNKVWFSTPI